MQDNLPMGRRKEQELKEEETRHSVERPANQACAGKMNGVRIRLSFYEQQLTVKWAS